MSTAHTFTFKLPETLPLATLKRLEKTLAPHPLRLVGGVVRDLLANLPPKDIDLATPCPPNEVMERLKKAGIKALPTGLEHGTVTAVVEGRPYEITTLRCDISTDGRRAQVRFTDDFATDAARRDFTINALYLTLDGHVYDYHHGADDLKNKTLRFIGTPADRLREDHLRALRFVRFWARFSLKPVDGSLARTLHQHAPALGKLSAERITAELTGILMGPAPASAVGLMQHLGQLDALGMAKATPATLEKLLHLYPGAPLATRLCSLAWPAGDKAAVLGNAHLALPGTQRQFMARLFEQRRQVPAASGMAAAAYRLGPDLLASLLALEAATGYGPACEAPGLIATAATTIPPVFPLNGHDLQQLGASQGPALGQALHQLEQWWIEQGFPARDACLTEAKKRITKRF